MDRFNAQVKNTCLTIFVSSNTRGTILAQLEFSEFPRVELEVWNGSDETTLGKHEKTDKQKLPKGKNIFLSLETIYILACGKAAYL